MHSTTKPRESDPHDVFAIAPELVPAAWADKVVADITRGPNSHPSDQPPHAGSGAAVGPAPTVDTTFRATATGNIRVPGGRPPIGRWASRAVMAFMFALCSALAAAAWRHYGDEARQTISDWTPAFALNASPPPEKAALAEQPDTPAVQASAADQASPQLAAPAQPPEAAAPAATALSPESAQLQSLTRDVAAMGQQIEQLRASIAELKAGQQPMVRDAAKSSEAKPSEVKPSEVKPSGVRPSEVRPSEVRTSAQNLRPKMSSPPPQPAAVPARAPMPAYSPPPAAPRQAAAIPPMLPQAAPPPALAQPAPPPQRAAEPEDEPVLRPPMPVR